MEATKTPNPSSAAAVDGALKFFNVQNKRPEIHWQKIFSSLGGFIFTLSFLGLTEAEDTAVVGILLSLLVTVGGYAASSFIPERFRSIGIGVLLAGLVSFIISLNQELDDKTWLVSLLLGLISAGLYAAPGTKGKPVFLTILLSSVWLIFIAISFEADSVVTAQLLSLLFSAGCFTGVWYLDKNNQTRIGLSFAIAGIVSLFITFVLTVVSSYISILSNSFGSSSVDSSDILAVPAGIAIVSLFVGLFAIYVGYKGKRRATAWSGAVTIVLVFIFLTSFGGRWYSLIGLLLFAPALLLASHYADVQKVLPFLPALPGSGSQKPNVVAPQQAASPQMQPSTGFPGTQSTFGSAQSQQNTQIAQQQQQAAYSAPSDPTRAIPNPMDTVQTPIATTPDSGSTSGAQTQVANDFYTPAEQNLQAQEPAQTPPASTIKPDWYPDPTSRFEHRWHDGSGWTQHVSNAGTASVDPQPVE